jgi:hypothetical protein
MMPGQILGLSTNKTEYTMVTSYQYKNHNIAVLVHSNNIPEAARQLEA